MHHRSEIGLVDASIPARVAEWEIRAWYDSLRAVQPDEPVERLVERAQRLAKVGHQLPPTNAWVRDDVRFYHHHGVMPYHLPADLAQRPAFEAARDAYQNDGQDVHQQAVLTPGWTCEGCKARGEVAHAA